MRLRLRLLFVSLLLLPLLAPGAPGPTLTIAADAQFDAANKLYAQGKFAEAATAYDQMIQGGSLSPALYFNLGNAWFKSGHIGRAIAAYRHAREMSPRDPDIRANLQFARNGVPGPKLSPGRAQRWLGKLTLTEWIALATAAFWVTLGLFIAGQLKPALKPVLHSWLWVAVGVTAVVFTGVGLAVTQNDARQVAIVASREASVRNSPFDESPAAFTVHDGAELRVLDRKDNWLQVTDGTTRVGWLKTDAVVGSAPS